MILTEITVGDWSRDGAGHFDSYKVTGGTAEQIEKAYELDVNKFGYDVRRYCDWDQNTCLVETAPPDFYKALYRLEPSLSTKSFSLGDGCIDGPEHYVDIYLAIAKLGDPSLKLKRLKTSSSIHLGGDIFYE